jgi:hypothetical protein
MGNRAAGKQSHAIKSRVHVNQVLTVEAEANQGISVAPQCNIVVLVGKPTTPPSIGGGWPTLSVPAPFRTEAAHPLRFSKGGNLECLRCEMVSVSASSTSRYLNLYSHSRAEFRPVIPTVQKARRWGSRFYLWPKGWASPPTGLSLQKTD